MQEEFKLSDMAKELGISISKARYYFQMGFFSFSAKSEGGHYRFDQEAFRRLTLIVHLRRDKRLTIPEIKEYFKENL